MCAKTLIFHQWSKNFLRNCPFCGEQSTARFSETTPITNYGEQFPKIPGSSTMHCDKFPLKVKFTFLFLYPEEYQFMLQKLSCYLIFKHVDQVLLCPLGLCFRSRSIPHLIHRKMKLKICILLWEKCIVGKNETECIVRGPRYLLWVVPNKP